MKTAIICYSYHHMNTEKIARKMVAVLDAKYLKGKMRAGDTIALSVSVTDSGANIVHSESFNAKVIGLAISYADIGVLNLRYFTVSFQEAP
jgi:hypothetical protein